jgi:hypothetical protein
MISTPVPALLACVTALLAAGCGTRNVEPAPRDVREPSAEVSASPARAKVAELVELKITVEHPEDLKARLPAIGATLEDLEVVNPGNVTTRHLEPGIDLTERVVTVRGFRPGAYSVGPFDILLVPEGGTVKTISSAKTQIEIYTVVKGATRLADLRPSKGPFDLPPAPASWMAFVIVAVLAVVGGIGAALYLRWSARAAELCEREAARRPADEVALEELRLIRDSKILEEGQVSEFTDKVSDVLRRYLEARYELPAPDRTTEEFLDVIAREPILDRDRKKFLADYLAQCDLVKFAAHDPGRKDLERLYESSVTFVHETAEAQTGSA